MVEAVNELTDVWFELEEVLKLSIIDDLFLELGAVKRSQSTEAAVDSHVVGRDHLCV